MATLATTDPNLLDLYKRMDPEGRIDAIVEILNLRNEVLEDADFQEGNLPTGHRTTIRTGIPMPTWRKLYGGVQPNKSTTTQVTDNTGMLEAYAEVDKALADLNGNTAEFRLSEDRPHIEGMNQTFVSTLFYGNEGTQPEAFTGFAPRFNSLSTSTAQSADNVITGGGSGADNQSIWLVVWGPNTVFCIYPKGSNRGLYQEDKGQVTIENADGSGGRMEAYRSHYRWDCGLVVRDWRYVARIPNIDKSDLTKNAASGADLIDLMTQAIEQIADLNMGRPVFYVSRYIRSFLRRQMANKLVNSTLNYDLIAGKRVLSLDGIPIRRVDALAANEAVVS